MNRQTLHHGRPPAKVERLPTHSVNLHERARMAAHSSVGSSPRSDGKDLRKALNRFKTARVKEGIVTRSGEAVKKLKGATRMSYVVMHRHWVINSLVGILIIACRSWFVIMPQDMEAEALAASNEAIAGFLSVAGVVFALQCAFSFQSSHERLHDIRLAMHEEVSSLHKVLFSLKAISARLLTSLESRQPPSSRRPDSFNTRPTGYGGGLSPSARLDVFSGYSNHRKRANSKSRDNAEVADTTCTQAVNTLVTTVLELILQYLQGVRREMKPADWSFGDGQQWFKSANMVLLEDISCEMQLALRALGEGADDTSNDVFLTQQVDSYVAAINLISDAYYRRRAALAHKMPVLEWVSLNVFAWVLFIGVLNMDFGSERSNVMFGSLCIVICAMMLHLIADANESMLGSFKVRKSVLNDFYTLVEDELKTVGATRMELTKKNLGDIRQYSFRSSNVAHLSVANRSSTMRNVKGLASGVHAGSSLGFEHDNPMGQHRLSTEAPDETLQLRGSSANVRSHNRSASDQPQNLGPIAERSSLSNSDMMLEDCTLSESLAVAPASPRSKAPSNHSAVLTSGVAQGSNRTVQSL